MVGPLALVAVAGVSLFLAWDYGLWSFGSPGAGLMPSLAAALVVVASLLALREKRAPDTEEDGEPDHGRVARYMAGLVLLPPAIIAVGMLPALGLFILVLLRFAERMNWWAALAIAASSTAASWLLFERLLQVPLPRGLWG